MSVFIMVTTLVVWSPTGGTMVLNQVTPHKTMKQCIKHRDKQQELLKVRYKNVGTKCIEKVMPLKEI